jgi:hypothetical protein
MIKSNHPDLVLINYLIFKEVFFEFLDKREKVLSTVNLVSEMGEAVINSNNEEKKMEIKQNNVEYPLPEEELNLLILQRSLYILKKKLDENKDEVGNIYSKYSEKSKLDLVIKLESRIEDLTKKDSEFVKLLEEILNLTSLSLNEIQKPNELFRLNLFNNHNTTENKRIFKLIENFTLENRKKYNYIMREKKEKGKVDINNINNLSNSNNKIEEEDFLDIQEDGILDMVNQADLHPVEDQIGEEKLEEETKTINKNSTISEKDVELNKDTKLEIKSNFNDNTEKSEKNKLEEKERHPIEVDEKNKSLENKKDEEEQAHDHTLKSMANNLDKEIKNFINKNDSSKKLNKENVADITINASRDDINSSIINSFQPGTEQMNKLKISHKKHELFLLIEVLPLIIADFLQINQHIILDLISDETNFKNELRILFDNEIIARLGEENKSQIEQEKTNQLKNLLYEKLNLDKNIRTYEDILLKKKSVRDNTIFIEQMLKKLQSQKLWIENKIKFLQEENETYNIHEEKNLNSSNIINVSKNYQLNNSNINNSTIIQGNNISKIIPKKLLCKQELRNMAISEIFYFYARQHQLAGHLVTFDDIASKSDRMDLGEFMKFCLEFKIPVRKEKLVEIFKKSASNTKQMSYEEFVNSLKTVSVKTNEEERLEIIKRINKLKGANNKEKPKIKNQKISEISTINKAKRSNSSEKQIEMTGLEGLDPNNAKSLFSPINKEANLADQNDQDNSQRQIIDKGDLNKSNLEDGRHSLSKLDNDHDKHLDLKEIQEINNSAQQETLEEINKLKENIKQLKEKSYEKIWEDFLLFLEIDNEKLYRIKMKGFVLPFHSEKTYRIPNDIIMQRARKFDPRTAEEIKRILKERKEEKQKMKEDEEKLLKLRQYDQKRQLHKINQKLSKDRERFVIGKESNYAEIKHKHEIFAKEKETKLTWDVLEHMNYEQFISNRDDDFNPKGLIDTQSEDDDLSFLEEKKEGNKNNKIEILQEDNYKKQYDISNQNQAFLEKKMSGNHLDKNINYSLNENIVSTNNTKPSKKLTTKDEMPKVTITKRVSNSEQKGNILIDKNKKSLNVSTDVDKTLDSSKSPKRKSMEPKEKEKHNKKLNRKLIVEKTEKKAKDLEKEWENKQAKVRISYIFLKFNYRLTLID